MHDCGGVDWQGHSAILVLLGDEREHAGQLGEGPLPRVHQRVAASDGRDLRHPCPIVLPVKYDLVVVKAHGAIKLTGARAFPGEDVSDTLATVLKFEPDWTRLPADTPPAIHRLLKRCLVKDPKLRLRECGSALVDIHEALSGSDPSQSGAPSMVVTPAAVPRRSMLPVLAAAAALTAVVAVATWAVARNQATPDPQPTRRFTITLPPSDVLPASLGSLLAISPDGRTLVYRSRRGTTSTQLFRRPLDRFEGVAIAGTEGGFDPFFSFDGQWLGFNAEGSLKKVALVGGPPLTVAAVDSLRGANWGSDGRIVFGTQSPGGRLMQAGASGGDATELFKIDGSRQSWYPQVLPGGKAVLFTLSETSSGCCTGRPPMAPAKRMSWRHSQKASVGFGRIRGRATARRWSLRWISILASSPRAAKASGSR